MCLMRTEIHTISAIKENGSGEEIVCDYELNINLELEEHWLENMTLELDI